MWLKELLLGKGNREGKAYSELLRRYDAYLQLLRANSGLLEAFSDLESMAGFQELCGWERLRGTVLRLNAQAAIMARMLQALCGEPTDGLLPALDRLAAAMREKLIPLPAEEPSAPLIHDWPESADAVQTRGFRLSPRAFREYLRHNDVEEMARIFWDTMDPADPSHVEDVSEMLKGAASAGQIPPGLESALAEAGARLKDLVALNGTFAVVSRAASTKLSVLDVSPDKFPSACRDLFCAYFDKGPVSRRLKRGYGALEEDMAVEVVPMEDFRAEAPGGGPDVEEASAEPVRRALSEIMPLVLPLHAADAGALDFQNEGFATLSEAVLFMHTKALQAVAALPELLEKGAGKKGLKVREWLPVELRLVALGSGIAEGAKGGVVSVEEVTSAPAAALLRGLMDESLQAPGQRLADMQGFLSVMSGSLITTPEIIPLSWAMISDRYLQFSSRIGYHYTELEAYAGPRERDNRVRFVFKGGAGEERERHLRARFVARVLEGLGFVARLRGDFVSGVFSRAPAERVEAIVAQLGRLIVCASQPDLIIAGEAQAESLSASFLKGDYKKLSQAT